MGLLDRRTSDNVHFTIPTVYLTHPLQLPFVDADRRNEPNGGGGRGFRVGPRAGFALWLALVVGAWLVWRFG